MSIKPSYLFAAAILGVVVIYFTVNTLFSGASHSKDAKPKPAANALPLVKTAQSNEEIREDLVTVRGRTESARSVVVRAETSGVVQSTPAREGGFVNKGDILCRLAVDARQATLDQARAALRSRQLTQAASANLAAKGFRSPTQVLQDQAALDGASAAVRQAEIALRQVNIRAPFSGVFDNRDAEIGPFLSPGQPCGTVIELDPILIVGDLPETETSKVHVGAKARSVLVSGQVINGTVRYLARQADPQTRTYRVEVQAANPSAAVRAGLSSDIKIAAGSVAAHRMPTSALVLDAAGRQGVRYVGPDNVVAFAPVRLLEETPDGVWVAGLKGSKQIIVVGQSYVSEGQRVRVAAR